MCVCVYIYVYVYVYIYIYMYILYIRKIHMIYIAEVIYFAFLFNPLISKSLQNVQTLAVL